MCCTVDVLQSLMGFALSVSVHIAKDRDTNAPRGFAFITYTSSTDCNKACTAMDGKVCYFVHSASHHTHTVYCLVNMHRLYMSRLEM